MIAKVKQETFIRTSIDNLDSGIIGKIFKDTRILVGNKKRGKLFKEGDRSSNMWFQDQNGWYYWSGALQMEEIEWNYNKKLVNAPEKWMGNRGKEVKIMVIDSGFDLTHPALKHLDKSGFKYDVTLENFKEQDGNTSVLHPFSNENIDRNDHGNMVLSILAAVPTLDFDIQGIADESEIIMVKARDNRRAGKKQSKYYIRALELAAKLNVDIVTCSMAFESPLSIEKERYDKVMKQLDSKKTIVAQALSNFDRLLLKGQDVKFPADNSDTLSIGMVKNDFYKENIFNGDQFIGKHVDLLMPNMKLRLLNRKGITDSEGSSFATPYCAGLIALFLASNGGRKRIDLPEEGSGRLRKFYLQQMKSNRAFASFDTNQKAPYFFLPKHN